MPAQSLSISNAPQELIIGLRKADNKALYKQDVEMNCWNDGREILGAAFAIRFGNTAKIDCMYKRSAGTTIARL